MWVPNPGKTVPNRRLTNVCNCVSDPFFFQIATLYSQAPVWLHLFSCCTAKVALDKFEIACVSFCFDDDTHVLPTIQVE